MKHEFQPGHLMPTHCRVYIEREGFCGLPASHDLHMPESEGEMKKHEFVTPAEMDEAVEKAIASGLGVSEWRAFLPQRSQSSEQGAPKLLPCPFCGGQPEPPYTNNVGATYARLVHKVNCWLAQRSHTIWIPNTAFELWNTRTRSDICASLEAENARLLEQYKTLDVDWRELDDENERLVEALEAVTMIAGNLTDEAVEAVGGINDARSRALMVVHARKIARTALDQVKTDDK